MSNVVYEHRCKNEDCPVDTFDTKKRADEVCPECGSKAIRIFGATNAFRPTASPVKLHLKSSHTKKRGWRR